MVKEQNKIFKYKDESISYTIVRSKIKNIYICSKNGKVIVKAPVRASDKLIEELILKRKNWIKNNIKKQNLHENRNIDLLNNNYIYILNNKIKVKYEYLDIKLIGVTIKDNTCFVYIPKTLKNDKDVISKIEKKIDERIKEIAYEEISKAMNKYIKITGLSPIKFTVRKFKRIWGNCSSKKEIKINQNVIWYSQKEIEYVCLHEIAHLKYMNHKKEFWDFIEKYMPDYKERIKKLK